MYSINDIMYNCVDLYWRSTNQILRLPVRDRIGPTSRLSVLNFSACSAPRPSRGRRFFAPSAPSAYAPLPTLLSTIQGPASSCWKRPVLVETTPSCQNKRQTFHAPMPDGISADSTKLPESQARRAPSHWQLVNGDESESIGVIELWP